MTPSQRTGITIGMYTIIIPVVILDDDGLSMYKQTLTGYNVCAIIMAAYLQSLSYAENITIVVLQR